MIMADSTISILGIPYKVLEVECVNKGEPRKGEIDFIKCEIRIDKDMPNNLKEQVLMHEIIHAICDLQGFFDIGENENVVQGLATALYHTFKSQVIFS